MNVLDQKQNSWKQFLQRMYNTIMGDSIFTKIIKGEIPCHKVYEDDKTIVFLDIAPYNYGHSLVVPKKQIDNLWDINDELYNHVMEVVNKVARKQEEVIKPKRVGILVEGFAVPHAHVHVFPMYGGLEYTLANEVKKPTNQELATMAKRLNFS